MPPKLSALLTCDIFFSVDTCQIHVGHDGTGLGAGWFLDNIKIKNERYYYHCQKCHTDHFSHLHLLSHSLTPPLLQNWSRVEVPLQQVSNSNNHNNHNNINSNNDNDRIVGRKEYWFNCLICFRWFAVDEDDGKIERDLIVDGVAGMQPRHSILLVATLICVVFRGV